MSKITSKFKPAVIKRHPIEQSQFYKIYSIRRLEEVLKFQLCELHNIATSLNYRSKKINERDTQLPTGELQILHKLIGIHLSKIYLPTYVYSQKGRSFIDNAVIHRGNIPVGKTDLSKFFPSISEHRISQMFRDIFKCPKTVAEALAKICSFNGHLPTGSYISGYIAFFCAKSMFDEIATVCTARKITMSVFVDDITFSGENVTAKFLQTIRSIIERYGFISKAKKTKFYKPTDVKKITGVIIKNDEIRVPNSSHAKAYETYKKLMNSPQDGIKLTKSYRGLKQHQYQIIKRN